jgi:hypothetical protein
MDRLNRFLDKFDSRPGATDEQIASAEAELGTKLLADYVEFLKNRNGGEGFIGESYAALWEISELASTNSSYESQKWAPGVLLFGSDGGGEAFGFDTGDPNWPIVQIPFIGMCWEEARPLGSTFSQFVENLYVWNRL